MDYEIINKIINKNGIDKYIKGWNKITDTTNLNQDIKKYHKHASIRYSEELIESKKIPKFLWDNKNKIGRIVYYEFILGNNKEKNLLDEKNLIFITNKNLSEWIKNDIKGLIIDLRNHKGGNFLPFILSLKLILGSTTLFAWNKTKVSKNDPFWFNFDNKLNLIDNQKFNSDKLNFKKPIAIIIGNKTSSAGEFSASIFIGRKNVKFFGSRSAGFLSVNETFKINNDINLVIPTKFTTTVNNIFYDHEYIDVDVETKQPIKSAKEWILKKVDFLNK